VPARAPFIEPVGPEQRQPSPEVKLGCINLDLLTYPPILTGGRSAWLARKKLTSSDGGDKHFDCSRNVYKLATRHRAG
jgi:hypothetical protein